MGWASSRHSAQRQVSVWTNAAAIDWAETIGSLEVGKAADLVIWETDALSYLFYRFGLGALVEYYQYLPESDLSL